VLGSLSLAEANVLQCSFSVTSKWNVVNAYTCIGNIIMTSDSPFITSMSGVHSTGRTNVDVQVVVIEGQNIRFFPRGLEIFPKVQALSFNAAGILEISQADLAPFPNLVQLQLNNNHITTLRRHTFESNTKLQFISINDNPLSHVAESVFDNLRQLSVLELRNTVCMNDFRSNRADVQAMLFLIFKVARQPHR
jgi:Leucine rich repeat